MAASSLTYVFDENSQGLLRVMRAAGADRASALSDLPSLGIANGTLDPDLLAALGDKGSFALIVRDSRMLDPVMQRRAWRDSGVTLFILSKWGQLPLFELGRRMLFVWPSLRAHAESGGRGVAWRVSAAMPKVDSTAFRLVTGLHAGD